MKDAINPDHYRNGPPCPNCGKPIECITIVRGMSFNIGNLIKYVWRAGKKDPAKEIEDLEKAKWYLEDEIERRKLLLQQAGVPAVRKV